MPNKGKVLSIIAIIVGVGLIPTGIGLNMVINNDIAKGVPDALLGIQEEMLPEINDTLKTMAIPDVLLGIQEGMLPEINDTIKTMAIPDVLSGIYVEGFPLIHFLVNCTFLAGAMNEFYNLLGLAGIQLILNYPALSTLLNGLGYPPIKGVSEYIHNATISLNYTALASEALTFGNDSIGLPGLMEDVEVGWGVIDYLNLYDEAITDNTKKEFMINNYNTTWSQLTNLTNYIMDYFIVEAINLILHSSLCPPEYVGLTTVDISNNMYFDQWANASMGQLDLGELLGLPYSLIGFEAGFPEATNISLTTTLELFDPTNTNAFMNITYNGDLPSLQETDGLAKWLAANGSDDVANSTKFVLKTAFNLEDFQMNAIINWLWGYNQSFKEDVVPGLFLYDRGMTVSQYSEILFYDQWANASMGQLDLGELLGLPYSVVGFEAGFPEAINISRSTTLDLFDPTNTNAFMNITYKDDLPSLQETDGLAKWLAANGTDDIANLTKLSLKVTFTLEDFQMDAIINWLWGYNRSFKEDVVPGLFLYDRGMTVTRYTEILFYAQWTNCTLYPGGLILPIANGISGWEVGQPTPSNIKLESAELLFDTSNNYALVNPNGIQSWYELLNNPKASSYTIIKTTIDLDDSQMNAILNWLPYFRDNIVPILAQYDMNLPFNPVILSMGLLWGLTIPGGVLATLGTTMMIMGRRKLKS